jgi:hypothetical protein
MWLLVARPPMPDAPHWRGRRWLAAVDALAWPLVVLLVFRHVSPGVGLFWPVLASVTMLAALDRLHRAVFFNHRYRFTTWRWGRAAVAVLLMYALSTLTLLS